MSERAPSHGQLIQLRELRGGPLTAVGIANAFCNRSGDGAGFLSVGGAHRSMRRMEDRGWVRRAGTSVNDAILWELTGAGRHLADA